MMGVWRMAGCSGGWRWIGRAIRGRGSGRRSGRGFGRLGPGRWRWTRGMVLGIDCCFSFPAWFLAEHGCGTVFDFWRHVADGQGERWLARECEAVARDERF